MHDLATLVANFREPALDHAEGFLLLGELRRLAHLHSHRRWDRAMLTALEDDYCPSHLNPPFSKGHSVWAHERIPRIPRRGPSQALATTTQVWLPPMPTNHSRWLSGHDTCCTMCALEPPTNSSVWPLTTPSRSTTIVSSGSSWRGHCVPHPPLVGHPSYATLQASSPCLAATLSTLPNRWPSLPPLNPSFLHLGQSP
jgi:hypothetical protein